MQMWKWLDDLDRTGTVAPHMRDDEAEWIRREREEERKRETKSDNGAFVNMITLICIAASFYAAFRVPYIQQRS